MLLVAVLSALTLWVVAAVLLAMLIGALVRSRDDEVEQDGSDVPLDDRRDGRAAAREHARS